jgi:hypothetical protein
LTADLTATGHEISPTTPRPGHVVWSVSTGK